MFDKPAVIIDMGSLNIKAGFSCDNHPVTIFRTVVGRPRDIVGRYGRIGSFYDVHIGDAAMAREDELNLNSPIVNGRIVNWDNIERVWHHIYYRELKVAPEERAVITTVAGNTSMAEKLKFCEVFFETLNTPALCIRPHGVMAMYSGGVTTGICVDLGYDTAGISPVYEGGSINYAHVSAGYAGRQVADFFDQYLKSKGVELGDKKVEIIETVMKKVMCVSRDISCPRRRYQRYLQTTGGDIVEISEAIFYTTEMYFQPEEVAKHLGIKTNLKSLTQSVVESSLRIETDIRNDMYSAILLCGGVSMVPNLAERLKSELEFSLKKPVNVIRSDESYVATWMGAATFAAIPDAQKTFVTKKQYEDHGARIVQNRFLV